jgi:acetyl-CoA carboxylase biotin carboxyl carrier protein
MPIVTSPMAGTIAHVLVQIGDKVEIGQEVVILESMKMEIAVQAEMGGRVRAVKVRAGEFVDEGSDLLELE